jgi:hypothetical protein
MNIIGFDSKTHKWNYQTKPRNKVSGLHKRAREFLTHLFPCDIIYEEVTLAGSKTLQHKKLRCDFYIPSQKLMIEAHGEQHYKFNSFHFKDRLHFGKAKTRDRNKEIWCGLNDIIYIGLPHYESNTEWTTRVQFIRTYNNTTETDRM